MAMDVLAINGVRGVALTNPKRTESIAAVRLEVDGTGRAGNEGSSSRRRAPERGADCVDAEFVEIWEEAESESDSVALPAVEYVHFVA
jgi:hypothetical protein